MQRKVELERKGILAFLIITFAITYAVEGALILSGFRFSVIPGMYGQLVVLVAMWVPTVATFVTIKFVTHEKSALGNLRFGSWKPYVASALILPLCFAIVYGLTWALGLAQPDWTLEQFRATFIAAGTNPPPIPQPGLVLLGVLFASLLAAPFVNGLAALGEEIGWRGYLLPRLMPLGKGRAYLALGVIWGLWHMPLVLIGFTYPNQPILGTLMFIAMTTAFGIYINELTLKNNSCILAAWAHGIFNCQKLGVWQLLFPRFDPLLGGYSGAIGIVVWLGLGWWQVNRGRMGRATTTKEGYIRHEHQSAT
jgi:membrane protease YdiL (CAAX protease family)